jgi:hypothetical protein
VVNHSLKRSYNIGLGTGDGCLRRSNTGKSLPRGHRWHRLERCSGDVPIVRDDASSSTRTPLALVLGIRVR